MSTLKTTEFYTLKSKFYRMQIISELKKRKIGKKDKLQWNFEPKGQIQEP